MAVLNPAFDIDIAALCDERDKARRERDQLLEGVEAHRKFMIGGGLAGLHAETDLTEKQIEHAEAQCDLDLYALADRIKSKGGGDADADLGGDRELRVPRRHATRGGSDQVDGVAPETSKHRSECTCRACLAAVLEPLSSDEEGQ